MRLPVSRRTVVTTSILAAGVTLLAPSAQATPAPPVTEPVTTQTTVAPRWVDTAGAVDQANATLSPLGITLDRTAAEQFDATANAHIDAGITAGITAGVLPVDARIPQAITPYATTADQTAQAPQAVIVETPLLAPAGTHVRPPLPNYTMRTDLPAQVMALTPGEVLHRVPGSWFNQPAVPVESQVTEDQGKSLFGPGTPIYLGQDSMCTLAVTGVDAEGRKIGITAGHCGDVGDAVRSADSFWVGEAGTIVADGFLTLSATGVGADTTLARIVHRVEEAQDAKARTQQFMERFSKWYTPGIIALALVVGLITRDLELALTLLVIGCPGALVISVPVALVAGIGRAARDGILIKGGEFLETAAKVDVVALDKTGTITRGEPRLVRTLSTSPGDEHDVLRWAALAEAGSEHPLAIPVLAAAREAGIGVPAIPDSVRSVPGHGVVAQVEGRTVAVGNLALIHQVEADRGAVWAESAVEELSSAGQTPLLVAVDGEVIGALGVADTVRDEAPALVEALHRVGARRVLMLTGDNQRVADAVAAQVGIDDARASLLPEDKLGVIKQLQAEGHTVAMVGDGVNDAPALALADIGIAMGAAGSPVAIETADIALMTSHLDRIPESISLAKRTAGVMRSNIAIALVTVAALLAGVLFGGVTMAIGMLVHEASVLVVIVNAMRLLRRRRGAQPAVESGRAAQLKEPALAS